EECVEGHIDNEDFVAKDRSKALAFLLTGPEIVGLAIGDEKEVVKAKSLPEETTLSGVRVAGRIRHSEDSINPETLGFILTVSQSEDGIVYRFLNPQRFFDIQAKGLL